MEIPEVHGPSLLNQDLDDCLCDALLLDAVWEEYGAEDVEVYDLIQGGVLVDFRENPHPSFLPLSVVILPGNSANSRPVKDRELSWSVSQRRSSEPNPPGEESSSEHKAR